jgi:hypothetical protein
VVAHGRGADHLRSRGLRELDEDGADAAVGAVHQDGLPRADAGLAVQHLPCRDAVDHHGLGLRRTDPLRDRHDIGGVDDHVAGPAADLQQYGHPAADQRGIDTVAGLRNRADQVVAGDEGEGRLVVVTAAAHLLLGEGDTGRLHADDHLSGTGVGDGAPPHLQSLRFDLARQYDLDHFCGVHGDLHRLHRLRYRLVR